MLGIGITAVGLKAERERFVASIPKRPDIKIKVVTEDDYGEHDRTKFSPNRARNLALKALLPDCDGVVLIDADYLMPPGLIDFLQYPVVKPYHIWIRRRDISDKEVTDLNWLEWIKRPVFADCRGSCNYLSRENWDKVGGCDERPFGWGGDDDLIHIQIGKKGIKRRIIDSFPLVHVAHPFRPFAYPNNRGEENIKLAKTEQPNFLKS